MADNGLWYKLWCSADDDPDLDNLDISDFGRYCKLGIHVKAHGTAGTVVLRAPSRALCAKFQVSDFDVLIASIRRFPHVDVMMVGEGAYSVSFRNWTKYQGDLSTDRVRRHREAKRVSSETTGNGDSDVSRETAETPEKRREENEKRREVTELPHGFVSFWEAYPKKVGKDYSLRKWRDRKCEHIADGILAALKQQMPYLLREHGQFIPNPGTWLNEGRWKDEVPTIKPEPKAPVFRGLNITK